METNKSYRQVLVCVAVAVFFLGAGPLMSVVKAEEDIWKDNPEQTELSGERIEHLLDRIAEEDPQLAERLRDLRSENPKAFRDEIRERVRQRHGDNRKGRQDKDGRGGGRSGNRSTRIRSDKSRRDGPKVGGGRSGGMGGSRRGSSGMQERMQKKHEEYINWLTENYPEEAKKLAQSREKDPEKYLKCVSANRKKYGRIMEAHKKNPELAEVLKEDMKLKNERDELLREIRTADDKELTELTEDLREVVNGRFGLIVRRKQLQYEGLRKKLEKLQQEVAKREAEVEKLEKQKKEAVAKRVEELVGKTEKVNWD